MIIMGGSKKHPFVRLVKDFALRPREKENSMATGFREWLEKHRQALLDTGHDNAVAELEELFLPPPGPSQTMPGKVEPPQSA